MHRYYYSNVFRKITFLLALSAFVAGAAVFGTVIVPLTNIYASHKLNFNIVVLHLI